MNAHGVSGRKLNRVDWAGVVACVLVGISVVDAVGEYVHPRMDFWPAFGIKVAAGGAVNLGLLAVWLGVVRRKA